jgi:acetyltransferase-like isoleucine patch superfamily enzyme/glycosyltransferase involved in cell wall biosynthesis
MDTRFEQQPHERSKETPVMVDVLIQTHNEELNLPHTLASVKGWVNKVFVVDSGSTDRTKQIAEEFGAEFVHQEWLGYAAQKNWALETLKFESPWILILDADEAVTPELRDEITAIVSKPVDEVKQSGFYLNRLLIFMGRPIRHCGYYPSWNLRLFKRGMARYEQRQVHEHMTVTGPTAELKHHMLHEDRRGMENFFAKHNRYSTLEAREIIDSKEKWPGIVELFTHRVKRRRFAKSRILVHLPAPWLWRFIYMYFLRFGILDGRAGWHLSNFIASYELSIQLKVRDLQRLRKAGRENATKLGLSQPEGSDQFAEIRQTKAAAPLPMMQPPASQIRPSGNGAVAIPTRRVDHNDVQRFESPWTLKENIGRAMWMLLQPILFRWTFHNWYGWRRFVLRCFGANVGKHVRVRPSSRIEVPWNVTLNDGCVIGDDAILYSLGHITIGRNVIVSQYAHLCAGTHDFNDPTFPLLKPPITIEDNCWIAADTFVGPGVTIGANTVVGARSSVFKDMPANSIVVGNPAKAVRSRDLVELPSNTDANQSSSA